MNPITNYHEKKVIGRVQLIRSIEDIQKDGHKITDIDYIDIYIYILGGLGESEEKRDEGRIINQSFGDRKVKIKFDNKRTRFSPLTSFSMKCSNAVHQEYFKIPHEK